MDVVPKRAIELISMLREAGHGAWLVGGSVRDVLLNKKASDWDIATSALPQEVTRIFRRTIPTGIEHGTVTVLMSRDPKDAFEVTTLRGESTYSDGRHPDEVTFVDDITADLARRDFTVNAIAVANEGSLVDPFGGLSDLEEGVIRAVGNPLERFSEDGLRILRAARFVSTLGFSLDAETEAAFEPTFDVFDLVSPERVHDEWVKTMRAQAPSETFRVMKRTRLLARIFPELAGLTSLDGALTAMDRLDPRGPLSGALRLTPLLCAVGKSAAASFVMDYRFSRKHAQLMLSLIPAPRLDLGLRGPALRRALGPFALVLEEVMALLCAFHGHLAEPLVAQIEGEISASVPLTVRELPINGGDVLKELKAKGGSAGPMVGQVLQRVLEDSFEDPMQADRSWCLERISAHVAALVDSCETQ